MVSHKFEDAKRVIMRHKSMKDGRYNGSVLSTTVYLIALFLWPLYRPSFIYVECFVHHCISYCPFLLAIIPSVLHLCGAFCPPLFILLPFSFGHYTVRPSFMWSVLSTTVYLIALFFWLLYRPSFIYVECFVHHCISYCPFLLAILPSVLHLCGVFCPPLYILLPFSFGHYTVRPKRAIR
jgi:hypothetical protein